MKFVYFGYDLTLDVLRRLLADGHELMATYSFPCDNVFNFNHALREIAGQQDAPFAEDRITAADIAKHIGAGAELFLAAGYPFKIPAIDDTKAFGVNIHPSLLPKGRGIMPTPYIILDHPEAAGITLHKIAGGFDTGDILLQQSVTLSQHDTVETYSARLNMMAPDMAAEVVQNLPTLWAKATPQNEKDALHFPPPADEMRVLNFAEDLQRIDTRARAFGRYGSLVQFDEALWVVYDHSIWEEAHSHTPGTVVNRMQNAVIIAAKGGYLCLKEFQAIA